MDHEKQPSNEPVTEIPNVGVDSNLSGNHDRTSLIEGLFKAQEIQLGRLSQDLRINPFHRQQHSDELERVKQNHAVWEQTHPQPGQHKKES